MSSSSEYETSETIFVGFRERMRVAKIGMLRSNERVTEKFRFFSPHTQNFFRPAFGRSASRGPFSLSPSSVSHPPLRTSSPSRGGVGVGVGGSKSLFVHDHANTEVPPQVSPSTSLYPFRVSVLGGRFARGKMHIKCKFYARAHTARAALLYNIILLQLIIMYSKL